MNGAFNGLISWLPQPRRESMNLKIETARTKTARDESEPDKHGLQELWDNVGWVIPEDRGQSRRYF